MQINTEAFEAQLKRDGYLDVNVKSHQPNGFNAEHAHPFGVRAMVLEGELTLTLQDGTSCTYKPGDTLELEPGCPHAERYGPEGMTFLVGRRHVAA